jgi:hypothetical protein
MLTHGEEVSRDSAKPGRLPAAADLTDGIVQKTVQKTVASTMRILYIFHYDDNY